MKIKLLYKTIGTFALICLIQNFYANEINDNSQINTLKKIPQNQNFSNFYEWYKACEKLPLQNNSFNNNQTSLTDELLINQLESFFLTDELISNPIDLIQDSITEKNNALKNEPSTFYVEKIDLPEDGIVAFHGDLHGDIHSLNNFIQTCANNGYLDSEDPFKIKNKKFYMFFLGDYVDRGLYGAEVIYTILRMKNQNPDNVFLVRGNHEDLELNTRYGFLAEIKNKFKSPDMHLSINNLYKKLPIAIYISCGSNHKNIIQCCHGGIELGFNPVKLLSCKSLRARANINFLMMADGFSHLKNLFLENYAKYFKNNKQIDNSNGFMWNDFTVLPNTYINLSSRDGYTGTIFNFGELATKQLLEALSTETYTLRTIFRAHQHGCSYMRDRIFNNDQLGHPQDIGIGKLWIQDEIHRKSPELLNNISVVTFSVAPNAGYNYPIHAFGELHLAHDFDNWRLKVIYV